MDSNHLNDTKPCHLLIELALAEDTTATGPCLEGLAPPANTRPASIWCYCNWLVIINPSMPFAVTWAQLPTEPMSDT